MNAYIMYSVCVCVCARAFNRWYNDGEEITNEFSSSLLLRSVSHEMNGRQVSCEATNTVGSAKTGVTLIVECTY